GPPAHREVLHRALGGGAPQGVGGHLQLAHAVVLDAEVLAAHLLLLVRSATEHTPPRAAPGAGAGARPRRPRRLEWAAAHAGPRHARPRSAARPVPPRRPLRRQGGGAEAGVLRVRADPRPRAGGSGMAAGPGRRARDHRTAALRRA